jgi:hypothetical protein
MEFAFLPTAALAPLRQLMTPDKVLVGESYPGNDPKTNLNALRYR